MTLTLLDVAADPNLLMCELVLRDGEKVTFRSLVSNDINNLATFLIGLSPLTRQKSFFDSYDHDMARELCDAINKYDKLRFVLEVHQPAIGGRIVGLIEFGFSIVQDDNENFRANGFRLSEDTDCRFGLTLSDDYQGKGLGSAAFPCVIEVARQFSKSRIFLWGGVRKDNDHAIRYYEKHGFKHAGGFTGEDGVENLNMILTL